jgi:hypothetical protein
MRIYRTVALVLLLAQAGCSTTRVLQSPATELATRHATRIWVTHRDGAQVIIDSPRLRNDTIFGTLVTGRKYTLPLGQAETISVREISTPKTIMVGVGVLATVVAIVLLVRGGAGADKFTATDCDKRPTQPECMP